MRDALKIYFYVAIVMLFVACAKQGANKDSISIKKNKNPFITTLEPKSIEIAQKEIQEDEIKKEFNRQLKEKISEYKQKCNKKDGESCVKLAIAYQNAKENDLQEGEIEKLFEKGATYLQSECDGGEMRACSSLGALYESGDGVTKDMNKARNLYQKSCAAKDAKGCLNMGLLIKGCLVCDDFTQDSKNALFYFEKACEYGSPNACEIANKIKNK